MVDYIIKGKTYYWRINLPEMEYYISTKGEVLNKKQQLLTHRIHKDGYAKVNLRRKGKTVTKYAHRLIYQVFKNENVPIKDTERIVFKDQDRTNFSLDNLAKINAKDIQAHIVKALNYKD